MRWSQCILTVHLDGDRPSLGIIDVVILGFTRDLLVIHISAEPESKIEKMKYK